jgi:L-aminopeptidase/D-esterase-like protein
VNVATVGALAADAMAEAIARAVRQATGIPGYPSLHEIHG